jgi:hypothetical protein
MATLELPTTQTLEGARFSQLKWLLYGSPGLGKSTFFSKATDGDRAPIFLHTDPGLRFIKAYKQPIMSWGSFVQSVDTLVSKPSPLYSMVVLDTVDILFRMARKFVCDREGINHVSELEWGKGGDMVRDQFDLQIAKLSLLDSHGIGLAFISHSKDVEVRGRAVKTSKVVPTMMNGAYAAVAPLCDVIGYAGFSVEKITKENPDGIGRVVHFAPDETYDAKDRTGMLPAKCKLDFDVVRGYLEDGGVEGGHEEVEETEAEAPAKAVSGSKKKKRKA